jgi:septum formation protein
MLDLKSRRLILASASPRRAELLRLIGLRFEVVPSGAGEDGGPADPIKHVLELSRRKAFAVAEKVAEGIVVGADTIVVVDGRILGKPRDAEEAKLMLRTLSNRTHHVFTGFAIVERPSGRSVADYERTSVHFRALEDNEIEAYVATGHPFDKAGAYGIQDESAVFADRIEGCFYNVVGFPLTKFYLALRSFLAAEVPDHT